MATLGSEGMVQFRVSTCCRTSGKDATSLTAALSSAKRGT